MLSYSWDLRGDEFGQDRDLALGQVRLTVLGVGKNEINRGFVADLIVDDSGSSAFAASGKRSPKLSKPPRSRNHGPGLGVQQKGNLQFQQIRLRE